MTKTRKKLLIASIILSLSLNGCASNKNENKNTNTNTDELVCEEVMNPIEQNYFSNLEYIYNFSGDNKERYKKNVSFDYLIDFTNLTDEEYRSLYKSMGDTTPINKATFAKLVEEKTITDEEKTFDGKIAMTQPTFYGDGTNHIHQPIIIPESYDNKNILDFIDPSNCSKTNNHCEINCKKFITIDNQTLYYLDGKVIIDNEELFRAKCLYQLNDNNDLILLFRNQTGAYEN